MYNASNGSSPFRPDAITLPGSLTKYENRRNIQNMQFDSASLNSEEYTFIENSHAREVLSGLNDLRQNKTYCDVSICVENEEFPCHKVVLASLSSYFKAMFASNMMECQHNQVVLNGVEAPIVKLLLEYAYTAQIDISKTNVQALLCAANLLDVIPVRDACCNFLEKHMDESNCLGIYWFAEAHACTELQQQCRSFALRHFLQVAHEEEFLNLNRKRFMELISCKEIVVEKEEDIFEAILLWVNHDPATRSENFDKILEKVRLSLLSPYFLHNCVATFPAVIASPECQRLLEHAKIRCMLAGRHHGNPFSGVKRNAANISDLILGLVWDEKSSIFRNIEYYNPLYDKHSSLHHLSLVPRTYGVVVAGRNNVFLAGGEFADGSMSKSLLKYDTDFSAWKNMAPMHVARSQMGFTSLHGYLYAIGGFDGASKLCSVERYDPSLNLWRFVASMKVSLTGPASVSHGGYLYVVGGVTSGNTKGIDLVQRYNPITDTWSEMAPMLCPRSCSKICIVDSLIYVIGGWHSPTNHTSIVECYDPEKDEWEFKKPMKKKWKLLGIVVLNGKIYTYNAEEKLPTGDIIIECYNPNDEDWKVFKYPLPSSVFETSYSSNMIWLIYDEFMDTKIENAL